MCFAIITRFKSVYRLLKNEFAFNKNIPFKYYFLSRCFDIDLIFSENSPYLTSYRESAKMKVIFYFIAHAGARASLYEEFYNDVYST